MIALNRRPVTIVWVLAALLLLIWAVRIHVLPWDYLTWDSVSIPKIKTPGQAPATPSTPSKPAAVAVLPHVEDYFDQVFSVDKPRRVDYPGIQDYCSHVEFKEDVYMECIGIIAGMTSIISQVKVCLKMAIDSGTNLILPTIPLRDSKDLLEYNLMHPENWLTWDKWFDEEHLRDVMGRACPKMKIIHPKDLNSTIPVTHTWDIFCNMAPGYVDFNSLFWVGKPYGPFFNGELAKLQDAHPGRLDSGITVTRVDPKFLIYRITDDATGRELRLWNDLSRAIRFFDMPRKVTNRLVEKLSGMGPYYGVHFRTENDTIWSTFENQLAVDLDALDEAWTKFGAKDQKKPVVYLACGDEAQAERFVSAGAARGWEVTHKWKLLQGDAETTGMVNSLAFDFQGAVDLGIMVRSQFFFGITGSAFSSTLSNLRDPTGRYRGSSFLVPDDAGARTHLFNDGNSAGYPCCL